MDVLINNVGIIVGGPFEAISMEQWRYQFDVNVFGLIEITKSFLHLLRKSKGHIINISSIAGRIAAPMLTPYCASKFSVEAISDGLRREVREFNVKVTLVEPGPIDTPIFNKGLIEIEKAEKNIDPELMDIYRVHTRKLKNEFKEAVISANPVSDVTKVINHALTSRFARSHYLVGNQAVIGGTLAKILPDMALDKLIR